MYATDGSIRVRVFKIKILTKNYMNKNSIAFVTETFDIALSGLIHSLTERKSFHFAHFHSEVILHRSDACAIVRGFIAYIHDQGP